MKSKLITSFIILISSVCASAQQLFTPYPNNPVISFTQPNPGVWNDPSVIKKGSEYWMYATSPNGTVSAFDGHVVPYLLKSNNGINWVLNSTNPLLLNSATAGSWDSIGVETPSVIYFNSIYHMYYSAVKGNGRMAIGHATSIDGQAWTKDSIIITPSGLPTDWMSYSVAEPGAVVFQNQIFLYFTGVGARQDTTYPAGKSVIGVCTSSNGHSFSVPQIALQQTGIYPPALGYYGYSTPNAAVINNNVHLYYDVVNEIPSWTQVALHHAVSLNGISGFTEDNTSVFNKNNFTWTAREIRGPSVLVDSAKVKMWFAGDDFFNSTAFGIGYAYSNIATALSEKEIEPLDLVIYPNPSYANITVQYNNDQNQVAELKLYDPTGTLIRSITSTESLIILSTHDLKNSIYFLKIQIGEKTSKMRKIAIE